MPSQCVALFRGVNVGKAKRVAMADLRKLFESLGYTEVQTLLNSGNVVFSASSPAKCSALIEQSLADKLSLQSRVTILTAKELKIIVDENPLLKLADNPSRLLAAVVRDRKDLGKLSSLTKQKWGDDALAVGSRAAYVWCPHSILESPLFEAVSRALGDGMTARNWATMLKLLAMVGGKSQ